MKVFLSNQTWSILTESGSSFRLSWSVCKDFDTSDTLFLQILTNHENMVLDSADKPRLFFSADLGEN